LTLKTTDYSILQYLQTPTCAVCPHKSQYF